MANILFWGQGKTYRANALSCIFLESFVKAGLWSFVENNDIQISFWQRSKTEGSPGGILSQFKCCEFIWISDHVIIF